MQKFDATLYPNLALLDEKVKNLLLSDAAKTWATPRTQYEISRIHPIYFLEEYGWIRPGEVYLGSLKEVRGAEPIRFILNPVQLNVADRLCAHFVSNNFTRVFTIILKHRKGGISTLIAGFDYWFQRFYNLDGFTIADVSSHTDNLMRMIQLFQEHDTCGQGAKNPDHRPLSTIPMTKNKKGMRLRNGAMIEQDSGENPNPGTSGTINVLHLSEFAKFRESSMGDAETSLLNSVPRKGFVFVIKESTAWGLNKYAQDCDNALKGKSAWELIFVSWLDMPDCEDDVYPGESLDLTKEEKELMAAYPKMRLGHVKFRRRQIELLQSAQRFRQDFPLNPREPFLITGPTYFNAALIKQRMDEINFYIDWKTLGLEKIKGKYPDLIMRIKHHPRGANAALARMEDDCVIPQMVEFHLNVLYDENPKPRIKQQGASYDGLVSYVHTPEAKTEDGAALMFRAPRKGRKYVVVVDVAEGKKTAEYESDDSEIRVLDCFRREEVLQWGGIFDEEMTADYAVRIAKVYNDALIVPEMNNKCGGLLWGYLQKSKYRNFYYREAISGNKRKREPGWDTKSGIKKEVCGQLKLDFKNGDCLIHSLKTLEQMLYFVDKKGKLEAAVGHKDDAITCLSVGLKVISITPALRKRKEDEKGFVPLQSSYVVPSATMPQPASFGEGKRIHDESVVSNYL